MKPSLTLAALLMGCLSFSGLIVQTASAAPKKPVKKSTPAAEKTAPAPKEVILEAELDVSPRELAPGSTIEMRFPTAMIAQDKVGTNAAEPPLLIEPALSGAFEWTSTRGGIYRLSQPPQFNTTYVFKTRAGIADLEGKKIAAERLDEVSSAQFRVIDQYPKWFDSSDARRSPRFLFEFNDTVNPAEAAKHVVFASETAVLKVPARARHATGADFKRHYADPEQTWAEQVAKVTPVLADQEARLSALVIEPETPLQVAKDWKLQLASTLPNLSGRDRLAAGDVINIGEVKPFTVTNVTGHTPFDRDYFTRIVFSKPIMNTDGDSDSKALAETGKKIAASVKIEPPVEITQVDTDWRSISLNGKFALGQEYTVTVMPEIESGDGLKLAAESKSVITFKPNPPYVAVPSFLNAQLASGGGDFDFVAANVKQVRVRVKKLTGAELLEAIEKYQPYVQATRGTRNQKTAFVPTPIEGYPGQMVFERYYPVTKAVDKSELFKLNWREVLGASGAGPLFVQFEGDAVEGVGSKGVVSQTLVEFTDFGLMQKTNGRESMVFVVSLKTGKPVKGVRLTSVDGERKLLGNAETDENGIAMIRGEEPRFVIAEKDGDCTAITLERGSDGSIPLWSFGIATSWRSPWEPLTRTFLFSDRPVYKPGETAHVKAISRLQAGDDLTLPAAGAEAHVILRDPRYRTVFDKRVKLTATGSWADDITLPEGPTGWYTLSLVVDRGGKEDSEGSGGSVGFRVDEYRANTFEVHFDDRKLDMRPDRIRLPMHANYFMGKPLSRAKVQWSAYRSEYFFAPEGFEEFHFGDAPRWARYGQDRDADSNMEDEVASWDTNGDIALDDEGVAVLEMPMPPPDRAAMPQRIRVEADVTDINQQTIVSSTEFMVPGAEFIVGIKGPEYFGTAGRETPVEFVAVTADGKPHSGQVSVDVKIERQAYHTIKIATAGGGSTTKDQVVLQQESLQPLILKPAGANQPASATLAFKPSKGGAYFITAESTDSKGKKILSRMPVYVIGGGEFPWAMEDGAKINLQPDKKELSPGEEATVVVKTPIAGTALVTVERNKVHKQFVTQLSPDNPVIKVPVQDADSPNVFVSVIVVRGAADSPKQHKMPEYRLGYCELTVNSDAKDLAVEIKPEREEVKPGEQVNVTGLIKDAAGKPVVNSEVTLYAVDEGVLSLMSYETPEPAAFFHMPLPLAIKNWTSFESLLPEEAAARERGNKGFLVGGGGGDESPMVEMRRNFVATPLWIASAMSDASGKVTASFKAPDNLTRYRLMAVAAEGVDRFGSGESAVTINQPLMVEPVVPRFARIGDELLVKAVVHNTTDQAGEVEVEFKLDDATTLITEDRMFAANLPNRVIHPSGKSEKRIIALKAKETAAVAFPVRFDKPGTAKWEWTAKTTKWPGAALNDGTESVFDVTHPVPEFREVRYVRLDSKQPDDNLLRQVNPRLLEGDGFVTVNVSTSRLYEAQDALEYVLHYPYGCVEQTSSSLMPWLALGGFNDLFPEHLATAKTKSAIQAGANRLLRMVTDEGGLAYWPGGQEPSVWGSAYGGFALLKARDMGAAVPGDAVNSLLSYLSKTLRNLDDEKDPHVLGNACMALHTLAKGGKGEPAYDTLLYNKRDQLPELGKLHLALAMLVNKAPEASVKELLGWRPKPPPAPPAKTVASKSKNATDSKTKKTVAKATTPAPAPRPVWSYWWGNQANKALRLIAYVHLGLKEDADSLATSILQARNGRGEWGNTYTNAWTLTALAAYERSLKPGNEPVSLAVSWGTNKAQLDLAAKNSVAKAIFDLKPELSAKPLTIAVPEGKTALARVDAKAWPKNREFGGENKGYAIARTYEKLLPSGGTEPINFLQVGDMVVVRLDVEIGGGDRYLAINDALPAVFEAVNPDFDTQSHEDSERAPNGNEPWFCDHREIRADRALFFTDYAPSKGKFSLSYLARVIAEGDAIAPPAKIEAMYQPDKYGLSPTQRVRTLPTATAKVAGK